MPEKLGKRSFPRLAVSFKGCQSILQLPSYLKRFKLGRATVCVSGIRETTEE